MGTVTLEFLADQIATLIAKVDSLDARLGAIEGRLDTVESRLDAVESRLDAVEGRLVSLEAEVRALRADHEALDRRVREMTADGKLSLAFISRQMDRLLDEQGRLRDDTTVLTGMVMRLEGTVHGLTVEVRGEHSRYDRLAREVARLREAAPS